MKVKALDIEKMKMTQDFNESKFKNKINKWKEIKDFNWMKQEASPNFELIE